MIGPHHTEGEPPEGGSTEERADSGDKFLVILSVAQQAASGAELLAEGFSNEALTWLARASKLVLGLVIGWRLRVLRRRG